MIIGDFADREREFFDTNVPKGALRDRFHVTGFLPYDQVPVWLYRGHVGLYFMSSRNAMMGVSNKFFNYLCAGLPVLSLEHPIVGDIIRGKKLGTVFGQDARAEDIAAELERMARDRGAYERLRVNVRACFSGQLNWEAMERRLLEAYDRLLSTHGH
jgi:glycosyltransferase involved in cell wall biosynthesis